MKRKKENKNSEKFFSNKILRENKTMKNIEVTQKFSVNGKEFSSMKEVNRYLLEEIISSTTIEEIIENPENYISQIRKYTSSSIIENSKNSEKRNIGKKNMKDIKEYLKKENYEIERLSDTTRKASDWPVYLISNLENLSTIRYTKAVFELYEEILEIGIENLIVQYRHTI